MRDRAVQGLLLGFALLQLGCGTGDSPALGVPAVVDAAEPVEAADGVAVVRLVSGLTVPWGLDFLPDGSILITERPGRLTRFDPHTASIEEITGIPAVAVVGQGGLLDVLVDPGYPENRWVYLSYSIWNWIGYTTRVSRARLEGRGLEGREVLFTAKAVSRGRNHFGSRMAIDPSGHLLISVGDRGKRDRAQDLGAHNGKIIRITRAGAVPNDNPFVDTEGARPEIFSLGHRNPQGLHVDLDNGKIWAHEHGPQGGDEINLILPGRNYGWPIITYGEAYGGGKIGVGTAREGLEQPQKYYVPSIAPSGLTIYTGDAFPGWRGSLLLGSLKFLHLNRVARDRDGLGAEDRGLEDLGYRIREVALGPDGLVYLLVDQGYLLRLQPIAP